MGPEPDLEPGPLSLTRLMRLRAEVGRPAEIGDVEPGRRYRTIPILSGSFSGDQLSGEVLPGADWQELLPDGTALIDTRYTLRTGDGVLIDIRTHGLRTGPPEVLTALREGELIDPAEYYFRLVVELRAPEGPYRWLTRRLIVATGARLPRTVVYDAYLLD